MTYSAIITKYHGPTNTRGSRISARNARGRVFVPFDYGQGQRETVSEVTAPDWRGVYRMARAECAEYGLSDWSGRYWVSTRCCKNWRE